MNSNKKVTIFFQSEGEDDLKKKQLMELAIINGTYRDNSNGKMAAANGLNRLTMPGLLQARIRI